MKKKDKTFISITEHRSEEGEEESDEKINDITFTYKTFVTKANCSLLFSKATNPSSLFSHFVMKKPSLAKLVLSGSPLVCKSISDF
jgi:hypothetical protein